MKTGGSGAENHDPDEYARSGLAAALQTALTAQKAEEEEDLPPLVGTPHGTPPVPPY